MTMHDNAKISEVLSLVPSLIMIMNDQSPRDHLDSFLYWDHDHPYFSSLARELRRWQSLWESKCAQDRADNIPINHLQALSSCDIETFID